VAIFALEIEHFHLEQSSLLVSLETGHLYGWHDELDDKKSDQPLIPKRRGEKKYHELLMKRNACDCTSAAIHTEWEA